MGMPKKLWPKWQKQEWPICPDWQMDMIILELHTQMEQIPANSIYKNNA